MIRKGIHTNLDCCSGNRSHLTSLSVLYNFAPRAYLNSEPLSRILFRATPPSVTSRAFLPCTVNYDFHEVLTVVQDCWREGGVMCSHQGCEQKCISQQYTGCLDSPLPDRCNRAALGDNQDCPGEGNSDVHSAQSHMFSPKPHKEGFSLVYLHSWLLYLTYSLYHSQCLILSPCPLDTQRRQVRI